MVERRWRVVILSDLPDVLSLLTTVLRRLGSEPVAALSARGAYLSPGQQPLSDDTAPAGLSVFLLADKEALEPILQAVRPDFLLCWAFAWRIPPEALAVPKLGSVNYHPSLLPRYRGPNPLAWAVRNGDDHFGVTWHRMDPRFDAGPILGQRSTPMAADDTLDEVVLRLNTLALRMLPDVMDRLASGDEGVPQSESGASHAPRFGDDYSTIDWSSSRSDVHRQVRAWGFTLATSSKGPVAEVNGQLVRILKTSLADPGPGAPRVECSDGPIWILDSEPVDRR